MIDPATVPILIDTREQTPWSEHFAGPWQPATLPCGDYSLPGMSEIVAVERKSLPDLISSLTHGRKRFEQELKLARRYWRFWIIVEATAGDVLRGDFGPHTRANPRAVWESCAAFAVRYAPIVFGGDARTCAALCESLLRKSIREHTETVKCVDRAMKKLAADSAA